ELDADLLAEGRPALVQKGQKKDAFPRHGSVSFPSASLLKPRNGQRCRVVSPREPQPTRQGALRRFCEEVTLLGRSYPHFPKPCRGGFNASRQPAAARPSLCYALSLSAVGDDAGGRYRTHSEDSATRL